MAHTILRFPLLMATCLFWVAWMPLNPLPGFADADYRQVSWRTFERLPEAKNKLDLLHPDYALLNAAVFFATNRARAQRRLPPLQFDEALRNMAAYHAGQMARYHFVGHNNPRSPRYGTVEARGRKFGAAVNAENVASTFLHQYRSGSRYYTRQTHQGDIFYDASTDRPLAVHSYWSFAQEVVQSWLDSPGHRRNILHPQLKRLGCACEVGDGDVNSGELPLAYCGQNFGM